MRNIKAGTARFLLAAALALGISAPFVAYAQSQAAPATQQKPKRAKKVWTNDDITDLRTPSDTYLREKERLAEEAQRAREAEEAAKKEAAAKGEVPAEAAAPEGEAPKPAPIPNTIPALEKRLSELQQRIDSIPYQIAALEELKVNGREDERAGANSKIEELKKELEKAQEEIATVRERLSALRAKPS
jgi:FtsZ-binding cell division protein ZapB